MVNALIAKDMIKIVLSVICRVAIHVETDTLISTRLAMTVVLMIQAVCLAIMINVKVVGQVTTGINNTASNAKSVVLTALKVGVYSVAREPTSIQLI
jgi:Mg2+/citrate symporter